MDTETDKIDNQDMQVAGQRKLLPPEFALRSRNRGQLTLPIQHKFFTRDHTLLSASSFKKHGMDLVQAGGGGLWDKR